jgi:hypothetical protein
VDDELRARRAPGLDYACADDAADRPVPLSAAAAAAPNTVCPSSLRSLVWVPWSASLSPGCSVLDSPGDRRERRAPGARPSPGSALVPYEDGRQASHVFVLPTAG